MFTNWIDSYCALRARAVELRGELELVDGSFVPRTTGHDAIVIAAVFDLAIRGDGGLGLVARWISTLADLADDALVAPFEPYERNPSFWSTLADAAVYLDDLDVPAPTPEIWKALDRQLDAGQTRNAVTEPLHLDDVYLAQYAHYREERGADVLPAPAGMTGASKPIPRTTNADVLELRALWAQLFHQAPAVAGTARIVTLWSAASADVDSLAHGDPDQVYAKNNEFWRTLGAVAIHVAVASEDGPRRNAGPSGPVPFGPFDATKVKTFDDLYLAQLTLLRAQRGSDDLPVPSGAGGSRMAIPRTTNADVLQLADYWTKQLHGVKRVAGADAIETRWSATIADVQKLAKAGKPTDVYARNNEFWHALGPTTTHIAAADEAPSAWDLVKESLDYSIHHLPETLEAAAGSVGHAAAAVADEVKAVAWGAVRTPLLIGGAALVGAYFLFRSRGP